MPFTGLEQVFAHKAIFLIDSDRSRIPALRVHCNNVCPRGPFTELLPIRQICSAPTGTSFRLPAVLLTVYSGWNFV